MAATDDVVRIFCVSMQILATSDTYYNLNVKAVIGLSYFKCFERRSIILLVFKIFCLIFFTVKPRDVIVAIN